MNSTDTLQTPGPGRRHWLMIIALWTFLGLIESAKAYVSQELRGTPTTFSHALIGNMPWWWMWALMTPLAFMIARRFPVESRTGFRYVPVHFIAAVAFTAVHLVVVGALYYATHARGNVPSYAIMLRNWFDNFAMLDFLTYGAIVGAAALFAVQARYAASRYNAAQLEVQAAQLEASVNEARLNALRMELNPHFLFNALNAISGLVRRQDTTAAVQALARLGDLLRISLDHEARNRVELASELEFLGHYLDIERIRFHDRLDVHIDVADDALAVLVPTLILQPLVENAVRHGIARKPGSGRIHLTAVRIGDRLDVRVEDTGVGLPRNGAPLVEGVGLSNTRARLARLHGDRASMHIGNNAEGGVTVLLSLPVEEEQQPPVPPAAALAGTAGSPS